MVKLYELIFFSSFIIKLSSAAGDSHSLNPFDSKVQNKEAKCTLLSGIASWVDRTSSARRGCRCDKQCIKYRDCCEDSMYYSADEQRLSPLYHCSESFAVYLIAQCPLNWHDSKIRNLCEKSAQVLDVEDEEVVLPAYNSETHELYGNQYCATCNDDEDAEIQNAEFACREVPPEYLKPLQYTPEPYRPRNPPLNSSSLDARLSGVQLKTVLPTDPKNYDRNISRTSKLVDITHFYTNDFKKYPLQIEGICANIKYDYEKKELVSQYENKNFVCRIRPTLPTRTRSHLRRCVPSLVRECPNGYENESIKAECARYTNVVYSNKTKKSYRNKDCARCNGEKEESVDGAPQVTYEEYKKKGNQNKCLPKNSFVFVFIAKMHERPLPPDDDDYGGEQTDFPPTIEEW